MSDKDIARLEEEIEILADELDELVDEVDDMMEAVGRKIIKIKQEVRFLQIQQMLND
jgi:hypothetical protein